jgi:hypothetical protein
MASEPPAGADRPTDADLDALTVGMFFDRDGVPVSLRETVRLFGNPAYRFLARDQVTIPGDTVLEVLTAWLGIDQRAGTEDDAGSMTAASGSGPVLFGTVALDLTGGGLRIKGREWFARTEAEALTNHARLLERLRPAGRA